MIEINLLPKDYRKGGPGFSLGKVGVYALAAAGGIAVILTAITFWQMHQLKELDAAIEKNNLRAAMLREDIRVVDALIDVRNKIQVRMNAVEKLDSHRSAWVRILEDLAQNVPEFVWLAEFDELPVVVPKPADGEEKKAPVETEQQVPTVRPIRVEGHTFTLNALAAFMIKMMRSDYFDEVELINSKDTVFAEERVYEFELTANVHYLSDEELRNLVAQAEEPADATRHKSLN
ncbi:MAG: PilN domain-containing protein [candidate division Zixibacteria bacterium]|nr:PilN domain-containing protein [candidate division Zixibacteria bacterium]